MSGDADIKADIRNLDMIPSDSADAVAAIHVVEHVHEWEVLPMIREWRRILKPGGKMILELPCMNKVFNYMAWCHQTKQSILGFMSLDALYGDTVYRNPAMCHKWGWFIEPFRKMLAAAEMRNIECCDPRYHFQFRDMRWECVK